MTDTYHVKAHVVREVVNRLRDTALEFHAHGSLRERLARELEPLLVASRPAEVDAKPVAYAVVSKKGGIHKLSITRASAERKASVWREAWPDNACTVRPLAFGDSPPSHTTNKEK